MAAGERPVVLVPLATARRAARRAGVTLNLSAEDIALAGKWKHGWIPLDAVASAVKAKRYHGGGGEGRTVKGKGRAGSAVESRREPSRGRSKVRPPAGGHRPKSPQLVQSDVYGNGQTDRYRLPSGHEVQVDRRTGRVNARDLYGEHRPGKSALDANPDAFEGHYEGSGMQRSGYYTLKAHDVSRVTGENLAAARAARPRMSREDAHVAVQRGHMTPAQARKATAPPLEGKSAGSMTAAERARAAEVMYGTGSKQHRKALATARAQQAAQDRTRRVEAARGEPKLADLSESDLRGLISRYGEKSVQADAARAEMLRRGLQGGAVEDLTQAPAATLRGRVKMGGKRAEAAQSELDRRASVADAAPSRLDHAIRMEIHRTQTAGRSLDPGSAESKVFRRMMGERGYTQNKAGEWVKKGGK